MALSTHLQNNIRGSAARLVQQARVAAEAEAQRQVQRREENERISIACIERRRLQDAKDERAKEGRVQAALKGIDNLFALSAIPQLPILHDTFWSGTLRKGGFLYYQAQDDQEHVIVGIYSDSILIEVDGESSSYRIDIRLNLDDCEETLRQKISSIASINRRRPIEILADFDRPGDNGDLFDLVFQVLVDASKENRLRQYLNVATRHIVH